MLNASHSGVALSPSAKLSSADMEGCGLGWGGAELLGDVAGCGLELVTLGTFGREPDDRASEELSGEVRVGGELGDSKYGVAGKSGPEPGESGSVGALDGVRSLEPFVEDLLVDARAGSATEEWILAHVLDDVSQEERPDEEGSGASSHPLKEGGDGRRFGSSQV